MPTSHFRLAVIASTLILLGASPSDGQWLEQASGFSTPGLFIYTIDAVDANVVWALAGTEDYSPVQEFTRTTNGGATWIPGGIPDASGLVASCISALDASMAWAALGDPVNVVLPSRIFKTTDGGATWTHQATAYPEGGDGSFCDIVHFFDANEGVAVGDPHGGYFEVYTTTNGGTNWVRVPEANIPPHLPGEFGLIPGPSFTAPGNSVYFGTNRGRVCRSTDRGASWTVAETGLGTVYITDVAFRDANRGLACAFDDSGLPSMARTTDGGDTWAAIQPPSMLAPWHMAAVPGTPAYVVTSPAPFGAGPGSAYTLDDGDSWTEVDDVRHTAVDFVAPNVGWSGGISRGPTEGGMWTWIGTALPVAAAGAPGPPQLILAQNYPNPFRTATAFEFSIPRASQVALKVFNIRGEEVATVLARELSPGRYTAEWNAAEVPSGVHFYRLQVGDSAVTKKLLLLH